MKYSNKFSMPTITLSVPLHCQQLSYTPNISSVAIYTGQSLHALFNFLCLSSASKIRRISEQIFRTCLAYVTAVCLCILILITIT